MEKPSPFASLFNSNRAPTDNEVEDLKALIKDQLAYLDGLNTEIQVLVERRDAHARVLEQHCALLSPLRRVPSDVLLSIFEHVCLTGFLKGPAQPTVAVKSDKGSPSVVLSHVCSEWRRLSLNHPILWSELRFVAPPSPSLPYEKNNLAALEDFSEQVARYRHEVENTIARHRIFITRSDPIPLTIALNARDRSPEPALEDIPCINATIVGMLCAVSTRWKFVDLHLTISMKGSSLLQLLELSKNDVPLLERLELNVVVCRPFLFSGDAEQLPVITGTELLQAPRLSSLKFSRFPTPIRYNTAVNCRTVTDLRLGDSVSSLFGGLPDPPAAMQRAIEVLTSFPNLVRCSISLSYSPDLDPATFPHQSPPISLPHLTSLTVRGSLLPRGFASSLDLPSLTTLAILPGGEPEDVETSEFVGWIRKFGQQLTELTFNYRCLVQSALLYCLENLPNVTTLRMFGTFAQPRGFLFGQPNPPEPDSAMVTDSVLEKMTPEFRSGDGENGMVELSQPLCPKLKKISLWPLMIEFTEKAFLKFVAARRQRHLRASSSPSESAVSLLETVIVFNSPRQRDLREVLMEDESLDLEEFVLVVRSREFGRLSRDPGAMTFGKNNQFEELVAEEQELMRN